EGFSGIQISDTHIETLSLCDDSAVVRITSDIDMQKSQSILARVAWDGKILVTKKLNRQDLKKDRKFSLTFTLKNPKRWWCNGMGNPFLYAFDVLVMSKGDTIRQRIKHGFRQLRIVTDKDNVGTGSSFYVELNGIPVFMRGANWVPPDIFMPRVWETNYDESKKRNWRLAKNKVEYLLEEAQRSHFNMLRVWGGGVYEDDRFYDACDSLGLLIWQDFMFAGSPYPGTLKFMTDVSAEVQDNVKRLRNHACLALWCGNNEIDEGWHNWGWQRDLKYSKADSTEVWNNYQSLFHQAIPQLVSELDSGRFYWSSSPSGGWGRDASYMSGDVHYWGVWWGTRDFSSYEKSVGRFVSEYGFQGIPALASLQEMAGNEVQSLMDLSLRAHQKNARGFATMRSFIINYYKEPQNFVDYSFISQLVQADGYQAAIDAHRRAKPYCMGSLFWQWNDPWPGISWSAIDWYGRKKLVTYRAADAFRPFNITTHERNDSIVITVINDTREDIAGKLLVYSCNETGKRDTLQNLLIEYSPTKNVEVFRFSKKQLSKTINWTTSALVTEFKHENRELNRRIIFYGTDFRNFKLEKSAVTFERLSVYAPKNMIRIKAKSWTRRVYLSLPDDPNAVFSNNGFDLLPSEEYTVRIETRSTSDALEKRIRVQCLNDVVWK
ncbi:MAG: glycoside hydrolase family 2 protein, partial [Bacteroidia bacterium]